jgi:hypothetical protein
MSRNSQALLDAFDQLPLEEKLPFAEEALRRARLAEMDREDIKDAQAALKEAEEKGTTPLRDLIRDL